MRKIILFLVLLSASVGFIAAEEFKFSYEAGSRYRVLSRVDEVVYVNGVYSHRADILNKISIEVLRTDRDAGYLSAQFQTSERAYGSESVYEWAEEYLSEFWRDAQGGYEIDDTYFMPVVRHVPWFPDRDLQPGDTWSSPGEEVHDLRSNFGIPDAYHFPIQVSYKLIGREEMDGRILDVITVDYTVFFRPDVRYEAAMYPVRISGYSSQVLYWDAEYGRPYFYREQFDFVFDLSTGDTVEYVGEADAKVIESTELNREEVAEEIREQLDESNVGDTEVRISDEGVTVSLEGIQFLPDSAVLVPEEKVKLQVIGEILNRYPDRDILIVGHTALAGTAAGRQVLSEERARAVGNYLHSLGVRSVDQITTKGMGAREPIAGNNTETEMRKNRRVEITILEN
ncbi:MAG: OmpA family protein [Spirochaetales bacterium]|nr:OmpA family protein [Spirochaetales bacterium]